MYRSVNIQFLDEVTARDIARFMHKLNIAISQLVHGKILQYTPPRKTKCLIIECPLESMELAEALELLPWETRRLARKVSIFEEIRNE